MHFFEVPFSIAVHSLKKLKLNIILGLAQAGDSFSKQIYMNSQDYEEPRPSLSLFLCTLNSMSSQVLCCQPSLHCTSHRLLFLQQELPSPVVEHIRKAGKRGCTWSPQQGQYGA